MIRGKVLYRVCVTSFARKVLYPFHLKTLFSLEGSSCRAAAVSRRGRIPRGVEDSPLDSRWIALGIRDA